jgi:hypothetical protein
MFELKLSFTGLLQSLISQAPKPAIDLDALSNEKTPKVTTSLRLEEPARNIFEAQAKNLVISLQECIALTLNAVMRASIEPQASPLELQVDRFFALFAEHDIPLTDVPQFLSPGCGIQRDDLLSREMVLRKLSNEVLSELSGIFRVKIDWLKGLQTGAYSRTDKLYKNANGFCRYLAALVHSSRTVRVHLITKKSESGDFVPDALRLSSKSGENQKNLNMAMVIEIEKVLNGIPYTAYEVVGDNLQWDMSNCRFDIKCVLMFCDRTRIHSRGIVLSDEDFESLRAGRVLIRTLLKHHRIDWHPDELVWKDERNVELDELVLVDEEYKNYDLEECEVAVRQGWRIKDWNQFVSGAPLSGLVKEF